MSLPWKSHHPPLPDHYDPLSEEACKPFKETQADPQLLNEYNRIICDRQEKGIVEKVAQTGTVSERIHYLPHHGVVQQDNATSKLKIVYDAST